MRLRLFVPALATLALSCSDPASPHDDEIRSLVAGSGFSCALVGVNAYCWGRNDLGQLGRGVVGIDAGPGLVTGGHQFRTLAASERTVCGMTDTQVLCWGHGRIFGSATPIATPTPIAGIFPDPWTTLGVGYSHGCVLAASGSVTCFGTNESGELGDGTTQPPTGAVGATTVIGGHSFSQLTVGAFHTCGLEAGKVWCWGTNFSSAFGPGTSAETAYPTPTELAVGFDAVTVEAGSANTCVIDATSQAWCWGGNVSGQLARGAGTASQSSADPARLSDPFTYTALAMPNVNSTVSHACGLTPGGSAFCWGLGDASQLGRVASETCLVGTTSFACSAVPAAVETGLTFVRLALGRDHTCGLTPDDEIYCWGSNVHRQLGDVSGGVTRTPVRVIIAPDAAP
jgi:alpha-tubulin suppressor-like RCC1 family protein